MTLAGRALQASRCGLRGGDLMLRHSLSLASGRKKIKQLSWDVINAGVVFRVRGLRV